MRLSKDEIVDGVVKNGYDYTRQCWVLDHKIQRCGHPESMDCGCYGRKHAGEDIRDAEPKVRKFRPYLVEIYERNLQEKQFPYRRSFGSLEKAEEFGSKYCERFPECYFKVVNRGY